MYACAYVPANGVCTDWVEVASAATSDPSVWGHGFGVGFMLVFGFWAFGWGIGFLFGLLRYVPKA